MKRALLLLIFLTSGSAFAEQSSHCVTPRTAVTFPVSFWKPSGPTPTPAVTPTPTPSPTATPTASPTPSPTATPSPTPPASPQTFIWVSDGDTNDLLYFIGTGFGTTAWSNPHPTYVTNQRKSDAVGTPADLTDRIAQDTYTNDVANSWISVDLGSGVSAVVSDYSLRVRNVSDPRAMRNWKLQGSNDPASNSVVDLEAATWTDIDTRVNDTSMPNTSAAWQHYIVSGTPSGYRWLRILQNGVNGGSVPDNYLTICEWQLYGVLSY